MAIRQLLPGDELQPAQSDADLADPSLAAVVQDLFDTMKSINGCLGLTAPQIGIPARVLSFDIHAGEHDRARGPLVILNPQIIATDGESVRAEVCFSLGGEKKLVARPERIFLKGFSLTGAEVRTEAAGLEARVLQHLIEHLEGKTFHS